VASTTSLDREYAYVLLRLKMGLKQNSLTHSMILCLYGDTKDVFCIGGLVDIVETPIAAGSRYRRQLINFMVKPMNDCIYSKSFDGFMDLNHVRINLYILGVMAGSLATLYITRHYASQFADNVDAPRNNTVLDGLDNYGFLPIISTTISENYDEGLDQ